MKEWVLALELERRYTKAEILEMYLNVVPWGGTPWASGPPPRPTSARTPRP